MYDNFVVVEEEAVISYTHFINEIDAGNIKNEPAHPMAIEYWNLSPDATLREVVMAVRADEAAHRDVNHFFSDRIQARDEDLRDAFTETPTLAKKWQH